MEMSGQLHALAAFPPGEIVPGTLWIGGWVGHRTDLDAVENRKILPLQGIELWPSREKSQKEDSSHPITEIRTGYLLITTIERYCYTQRLSPWP
jgi:hypothetical protein